MIRLLISLVLVSVLGCASSRSAQTGAHAHALPFIEDDWAGALAKAKTQNKPLFVETWADWCHTCRFMRSHVYTDAALAKHADRFIYVSLDTEREVNAAFLEKMPVEAWPTVFVVDPQTEQPVFKWLGSATVPQLETMFADAERALRQANPLTDADRLFAEKKLPEAAQAYGTVAKSLPVGSEERGRALLSHLTALGMAKKNDECVQAAVTEAPAMKRDSSFANVALWGLSCAMESEGSGKTQLSTLEKLTREGLTVPGLLADDQSTLYELLLEVRKEAKDEAGRKAVGQEWLLFVESVAGKANTPDARATFDAHRALAAAAAGQPARAIPALQQSEREFPKDYNPSARLGMLYEELGDQPKALASYDRALSLVNGPRRIRVLRSKGSLLKAMGEPAKARAVLEEALAYYASLPAGQRNVRAEKAVRNELETLK